MAVALAVALLFYMNTFKAPQVKILTDKEKMIQHHMKILGHPKSQPDQVALALKDLAVQKYAPVVEEAYSRINHKNSDVRGATAMVFKYFPSNKSLKTIKKLIDDPVDSVSFEAIRALGQDNLQDFEEILFNLYNHQENLTTLQKVAVYTSLMESTRNMEYQEKALNGLLKYSKHTTANYAKIARKELTRRMWSHPRVMSLMKVFLMAGEDFNFCYFATEKILTYETKWLDENLVAIFKNNGSRIVAKIRNRFFEFCPKNMWKAYKVAIYKNNGKNRDYFINTLKSIKYYNPKAAKKLINSIKLPNNFHPDGRNEFLAFKKELKNYQIKNPLCPNIL